MSKHNTEKLSDTMIFESAVEYVREKFGVKGLVRFLQIITPTQPDILKIKEKLKEDIDIETAIDETRKFNK